METEVFTHPPIDNVVLEIKFLPKLKIVDRLSDFQESIFRMYPVFSEEVLVPFQRPSIDIEGKRYMVRYFFQNEHESKGIRIAPDVFNFGTSNYLSFRNLKEETTDLWNTFEKTAGELVIKRIGLRYINKLKFPLKNGLSDIDIYTRPYFSTDRIGIDELRRCSLELRLKIEDKELTVRSGLENVVSENERPFAIYLLDYDCFIMEPNCQKLSDSLPDIVTGFHSLIENWFLADLKEPYFEYMRTGKWNL